MSWLNKFTKVKRSKINLVLREQKKKFAMDQKDFKPNLLIDDYEKNVQEWERAGGIGIIHKNGPNTIRELKRLGFK